MYKQDLIDWRLENGHTGSDRLEIGEFTIIQSTKTFLTVYDGG